MFSIKEYEDQISKMEEAIKTNQVTYDYYITRMRGENRDYIALTKQHEKCVDRYRQIIDNCTLNMQKLQIDIMNLKEEIKRIDNEGQPVPTIYNWKYFKITKSDNAYLDVGDICITNRYGYVTNLTRAYSCSKSNLTHVKGKIIDVDIKEV